MTRNQAQQGKKYFDRMSITDMNHIMAAILRVERELILAALKPTRTSRETELTCTEVSS